MPTEPRTPRPGGPQRRRTRRSWTLLVATALLMGASGAGIPLVSEAWRAQRARDAHLEERSFIETRLHQENRRLHRAMIRRIANAVQDCQRSHGVSPRLTLAVMIVESHARPSARSSKGAIGLMQVMPHMFEDLGLPGNIAHIESNIEAGCLLLADNIRRLGEDQGISAYFWGRDIRGDAYLGKVKAVRESLDGDRAPAVSAGLG